MNLAEGVRGAGRIVGRRERIGDSVDIRQRSSEAVTRSCQRIIESVVGHRRRQRDARVGRRRAEAVVERRQLRRRRRRRDAHRDVGMSVTVVANDAVVVETLLLLLLLLHMGLCANDGVEVEAVDAVVVVVVVIVVVVPARRPAKTKTEIRT